MPPARRGTPRSTAPAGKGRAPARRGARKAAPAGGLSQKQQQAPMAMVEDRVEIVIESLATAPATKNIMLHGPSGGGKTLLAGGAANGDRRVVFLSTETEGVASARAVGSQAQLMRCPDWEHAAAGVTWSEQNLTLDDWLVCDTGTKMQELYMRWILKKVNEKSPYRDIDIPDVREHQKYQNGFKRWVDRIIDGPFNSIFICQSMTVDDAEGDPRVIPLLLGKKGEISDYVSAQFSVAIYYAVARESRSMTGEITRRALCQPLPPWFAKDRYSALGKFWDVPEGDYFAMARMIEAIENSIKKGVESNGAEAAAAPRRMAGGSRRPDSRVAREARSQASSATPVRHQGRARGRS